MEPHHSKTVSARKQLWTASALSIGASVFFFVALLAAAPDWWDDASTAVGFSLGTVLGCIVGTRVLVDPSRFAPLLGNRDAHIAAMREEDFLMREWLKFPKVYAWASAFVYIVIVSLKVRSRAQAFVPGPFVIAALPGGIAGFFSSVILCPGVFYLYLLLLRKSPGKS